MIVLVCGSRSLASAAAATVVRRRIAQLPVGSLVISGGASGPDAYAYLAATNRGLETRVFLADWETHGKRAGIMRNLKMLDQNPDLVIAFYDGKSRGTRHTIGEARRRGVPVEIIAP
jgi:hypothetical protein